MVKAPSRSNNDDYAEVLSMELKNVILKVHELQASNASGTSSSRYLKLLQAALGEGDKTMEAESELLRSMFKA